MLTVSVLAVKETGLDSVIHVLPSTAPRADVGVGEAARPAVPSHVISKGRGLMAPSRSVFPGTTMASLGLQKAAV